MATILAIGSATKDIFFPTSEGVVNETPEDILAQKKISFELGAKYHIDQRFETVGGCIVNVAAGLKKLGEQPICYAHVGDDMVGNWIVEEIKNLGCETTYLHVEKDCSSDLSCIVIDAASADRVIFSNHVASQRLAFFPEKIGKPDWIFTGDLSGDWKKTLDDILVLAHEKNIPLAFNPRQKAVQQDPQKVISFISACQLLFVNKDEAIEIVHAMDLDILESQLNDESFLIETLHAHGVAVVVLTDGTRGAWGFDGKELIHIDALVVEAVDTTGAGDAFTSGFFAAHIKGKALQECLQWGIANSSSSVQYYGGQQGLLDMQQIISYKLENK